MKPLKPNSQRAKTAIILLWVVIATDVLNLLSDFLQYTLLQNAETVGVSEEDATLNDLRQFACNMIYLVAFIVSIITFIMWFRRAYYNLHQRITGLQYGEGWAAGGWFVPVISLFYPYKIMKELYVETEILLSKHPVPEVPKANTVIVGWWWGLWLTSNFLSQILLRSSRDANTISELLVSTELSMIHSTLGIVVGLLAIKVIKTYSHSEKILFEIKWEDIPNG